MTGYQSKKTLRHADDVTLNHLIDLRKLEAENERLRKVVMLLIEYEEHDRDICDSKVLWDELIEAAYAALKEKE